MNTQQISEWLPTPELSQIFWPIATVLIIAILAATIYLLLPRLLKLLKRKPQKPLDSVDKITDEVVAALAELEKTLARLKRGGDKAAILAEDAKMQAMALVQLIKGFALHAEDFRQDIIRLDKALQAVVGGDPRQIAEAAGYVNDSEISQLMLIEAEDDRLWLSISKTIANQIGVLRRWEETYITFSTRLIAEISSAKTRVSGLQASLDLLGAAEPLARIQANLSDADRLLQLRRQPEVGRLVEDQAPAVGVRLLRG